MRAGSFAEPAWARRRRGLGLVALLLFAAVAPDRARAQRGDEGSASPADPGEGPLTGTLERVRRAGAIRLGHRTDAIPFAFLDPRGRPVGYSLDLCRAIADEVAAELGSELRVELVAETAADRISLVMAGKVDLECGSTSSTLGREREVSFSPTIFVSATRVLVPGNSPIRSLGALRGRTIVVVRGTTATGVVQDLSKRSGLELRSVEVNDYAEALRAVASGRADAFAADEVLLRGLLVRSPIGAGYRLVGPELSREPYALAFQHGDEQLAALVRRVFRRLAGDREIVAIYDRWFVEKLPAGDGLRLPMSRELEELWQLQGLPSDGS